ncbi:D-inositol-3-phosphate glycosyltransferase [Synechococcus sp. MIT S9508]|nr:D-inositol-3-phosphate glycosyltransferase [Synechococcus sp. MIT S9508]
MIFSRHCRKRLAVLITHPVQYFQPVFEALANDPSLDLLVVFGCDHGVRVSHDPDFGIDFAWDSALTDGFPHVFSSELPLSALSRPSTAWSCAKRSCQLIHNFKPDRVLIFAYTPIFITITTLLLRQSGVRLMLRADGTDRAFFRSFFKNYLKDILLSFWYRQFDVVFPIGSDSNDHFSRLGVPSHRRYPVSYAVDTTFFADQVRQWAPHRVMLRREFGIGPTDLVLLWSAKMTEVKNPLLLIEALNELPESLRRRFWLIAMGDGPLRSCFESNARSILKERCRFLGFRNQCELGEGYTIGDVLVFPSSQGETWGLVVNEALQFGLAVLASDHPGCVRDLLLNRDDLPAGSSVFPSGDAAALASAMRNLAIRYPAGFVKAPLTSLPKPEDLAQAVVAALHQSK